MAMGKRQAERQDDLWIVAAQLPQGPGHPFYRRLNQLLALHGFDAYVEELCRKFYHDSLGRPGIPPGVYFRMLLIGYFEGLDSERGIAWRCADSRTLGRFLGYGPTEETPDHSSLSVIRNRIDLAGGGAAVLGTSGPRRRRSSRFRRQRERQLQNNDFFNGLLEVEHASALVRDFTSCAAGFMARASSSSSGRAGIVVLVENVTSTRSRASYPSSGDCERLFFSPVQPAVSRVISRFPQWRHRRTRMTPFGHGRV